MTRRVHSILLNLPTQSTIGVPNLHPRILRGLHPCLRLTRALNGLINRLTKNQIRRLAIQLRNSVTDNSDGPVVVTTLGKLLSRTLRRQIGCIGTDVRTGRQNVRIVRAHSRSVHSCANSLGLGTGNDLNRRSTAKILLNNARVHIASVSSFPVGIPPARRVLFALRHSVPKVVNGVNSLLNDFGIGVTDVRINHGVIHNSTIVILDLSSPLPRNVLRRVVGRSNVHSTCAIGL